MDDDDFSDSSHFLALSHWLHDTNCCDRRP